jgi:hypothetical protein
MGYAVPVEPLSPELALVDPELAERARGDTSVPAEPAPRPTPAPLQPQRSAPPTRAPRRPPAVPPFRPAPRRRVTGTVVVAALAVGFGLGGATAIWLGYADGGAGSAAREPPATQSLRKQSRTTAVRVRGRTTATRRSRGRAGVKAGVKRRSASRGGTTPRSGVQNPRPPLLTWPPARRATFYWVQLYRVHLPGSAKILDAFPRAPRLVLPLSWTNAGRRYLLTPGRYRWDVWPQFGRRNQLTYTRLKRSGTFVIRGR